MEKHSERFIEIAKTNLTKKPIQREEFYFEERKCDYCQAVLNSSESHHEDYYLDNKKINIYRQSYLTCKCNGIWVLAYKNANDTYTELYRSPLDIPNCHLEDSNLFYLNVDIEKKNFLKPYLKNHDETKLKWEAYHHLYERIIDLGNHIRIIVMLKTGFPLFEIDFNEQRFGLTTSIATLIRYSGLYQWIQRKRLSFMRSVSLICSIMDNQERHPISLKRFVKGSNIPELSALDKNLNCECGNYHNIKYLRDKHLQHNDPDFSWTEVEIREELLLEVYNDIITVVNKLNYAKGIEAYFENQLWVEDESDVINFLIRELMIIEHSYKNRDDSVDRNK
ncbi:MAG: hypothetical protein OXU36_14755 [Candidatus Poribacteria bacterium]|nr:hypothetical protein [Candidatus Poribacteria bacterium]